MNGTQFLVALFWLLSLMAIGAALVLYVVVISAP